MKSELVETPRPGFAVLPRPKRAKGESSTNFSLGIFLGRGSRCFNLLNPLPQFPSQILHKLPRHAARSGSSCDAPFNGGGV
jgi:hypothetical protein